MNDIYTSLGESGDPVAIPETEYEGSAKGIGEDDTKYSPSFYTEEPVKSGKIMHCKTCGNKCTDISSIEGECSICALKRLRKLETKLVQLKQLKPEREYCAVEGHEEVYKNKLFPEWEGKFVINGIELYPVFPLCKNCLDILSAYFVNLLEERGIVRKGSGHSKNKFSPTYGIPLDRKESSEAMQRLTDFINAATVYAFDQVHPMHTIYKELKERRKLLMTNEQKEIKKWQQEKAVQLPESQLGVLQLAEKYYPCLQNATDELKQRCKQQEINWLKKQPVPAPVLLKVAKIVEEAVKMLHLQLDPEEVGQQKWNKQSLTAWLRKEKKVDDLDVRNLWKWIMEQTEIALGPFADSAGEVLDQAMEKVTLSNLISESTTGE